MRYEPDRCCLLELYKETGISQREIHIITGYPDSQRLAMLIIEQLWAFTTAMTISKTFKLLSCDLLYRMA